MSLADRYRPRSWSDVAGQDKALAKLTILRRQGSLAGRAYWLSGQSGTGKTTIARLIAAEVSDAWATIEIDGGQCDTAAIDNLERECRQRPFGSWCWKACPRG
jgi:DNA polymerase-3 subunit gamma/tau